MHVHQTRLAGIRIRPSMDTEEMDAGFTLIELMVVLLIMAILLAIAIPTFLGVKGGAQDRAAQSNLETALQNGKAVYGNNQTYGTPGQARTALTSSEASLTFVSDSTPSTSQNQISVLTDTTGNGLVVVNKSAAGDCWGILTDETTTIGTSAAGLATAWPNLPTTAGTYYIVFKSSSNCSADAAISLGVTSASTPIATSGWTATKYPAAV